MSRVLIFSTLLMFGVRPFTQLQAAETAAEILPPTTLFYAEFTDPAAAINQFLEHSYFRDLQKLEPYQELVTHPKYLEAMVGLRFVEVQLGMTWRQAIQTIAAEGVSVAFDPATEGFVLIFRGNNSQKLEKLRDKIIALVRQDAQSKGKEDPYDEDEYRGIKVFKTKDGGFLTHDQWLIVGNNAKIGQQVADALLDGREDSFANQKNFNAIRSQVDNSAIAWALLNLEPLRTADDEGLQKLFSGQTDNPAGELLLGGIAENLKEASYVAASLNPQEHGLALTVSLPHDPATVSENRHYFFGPAGKGTAKPLQEIPGMLFGLSTYRNVSEMWLRSGDLFDEKTNDGLAEADSNLSLFFSGKDFGEDILGALSPHMQIIAARQTYPEDRPVPAIKVPAFALLAEMNSPEETTKEFRRIFHSFIGFFNVVGAMNGQPQFELDFSTVSSGELIAATPVPAVGEETAPQAKINFNFSPTIAFSGKRLILSSASGLAHQLVTSTPAVDDHQHSQGLNTNMLLNVPQLHTVLDDNREHLIAQNMLKEGHTHEEAEQQIGILMEILKLFQQAGLTLNTTDSTLELELGIQLKN